MTKWYALWRFRCDKFSSETTVDNLWDNDSQLVTLMWQKFSGETIVANLWYSLLLVILLRQVQLGNYWGKVHIGDSIEASSARELLRQTIYWWFCWGKFSGGTIEAKYILVILLRQVQRGNYWGKLYIGDSTETSSAGELLRQTIYWPLQRNRDATLASLSMILPLCLLLIFLWPVADTTVVYLWCFRNNITVASWWCCSARSCQFDTSDD